jgi:hypothetical protein
MSQKRKKNHQAQEACYPASVTPSVRLLTTLNIHHLFTTAPYNHLPYPTPTHSNTSPGKVLNTGLKPIGVPLGYVTEPLGNAVGGTTRGALGPLMGNEDEKMEALGGKNKDSYNKPEKIAGKEQTGDNPLGLDQTGRWGFQEDSK